MLYNKLVMSTFDIKMPGVSNETQWEILLGKAKKIEFRCAECTRPINHIGYCDKCKLKYLNINRVKNNNV